MHRHPSVMRWRGAPHCFASAFLACLLMLLGVTGAADLCMHSAARGSGASAANTASAPDAGALSDGLASWDAPGGGPRELCAGHLVPAGSLEGWVCGASVWATPPVPQDPEGPAFLVGQPAFRPSTHQPVAAHAGRAPAPDLHQLQALRR